MFIAQVVAVHADEKYMDVKNKFHFDKAYPIVYSHGEYISLGRKIGTFWLQCEKKINLIIFFMERLPRTTESSPYFYGWNPTPVPAFAVLTQECLGQGSRLGIFLFPAYRKGLVG